MQIAKSIVNMPLGWLGLEVRRVSYGKDALGDVKKLISLDTPAVIFDVGANYGQSIKKFRRRFSSPIIHAFEPSAKTFRELEAATKNTPSLRLNNFALGSKPGMLDLIENVQSEMSSFLSPGPKHWGAIDEVTTVRVDTLDQYCSQNSIDRIDLLKIDAQGFDLEVLRGAQAVISANTIRCVLIEITFIEIYQGAPRFDEVFRFLLDHEFRLISFYEVVYRGGAIAWADALFVRR
jgi:FkbM family methyltransferase